MLQSKIKVKKELLILSILILIIFSVILMSNNKLQEKIENIKLSLTYMSEKDITITTEKFNIYLFWGSGCPHCEDLITYLDTLDPKYKNKFTLYTFEVWQDSNNYELLKKFAKKLNTEASGVPFLIVGDKYIVGYIDSMKNDVFNLIKDECNKTNHIDIYQE